MKGVLRRKSPRLVIGLWLLGIVAVAGIAGILVGGDGSRTSEAILSSPSRPHLFGTDELGRDVLTRLLAGAKTSLLVALPGVLMATVVGTAVGLVSGSAGGIADEITLKVIEVFQIIPGFLLALVATAIFGASLSLLALVLACVFWPSTARLARGEALACQQLDFVESARALGASRMRILMHHVLPAVVPVVVVNASFQAGTAILVEAGLAFLGVGDRNVVSWGTMLADAQPYLTVAWWAAVFPGVALATTVIAMNLVGDGLNAALDVRTGSIAPRHGVRGRLRLGEPRPEAEWSR